MDTREHRGLTVLAAALVLPASTAVVAHLVVGTANMAVVGGAREARADGF